MSQRGTAATRRGVHSSNTSPSKPGLDSELEDFLQASKSITDNVRQGLELLSTEEDQLLKLRQQLGKIKRLREEQQQKDQVIQQLQERVAVLQHEKTTTGQQNSDLYVIMTERIHTLERHLQERDHVERRLEDQIASLECDLTRLPQVEQDLADSKSQCQQLTVQLHNAHEETNSLKLQLQQEKHLQDHFHATIESLTKDRLQHEEAVDHLKSEKQQEMTYLREEIMSLKQINEELRSKWRQSEQSKQQQDLEMFKTKHALEVLQQDHQAIQREYERYQQSNSQDTLQVVELKTTLTTLEFQHEQLQSEANADKAKYKTEINTLKTELRAIRSSVSEELSIFCHAMEDILQKDESDRSNAGLAAWQCRLLSSMRVAMSSCEGQDLHVVVHQLCVLLQHVLSLQLHASSEQRPFSWKKKPRSSPAKDGNETTAGQLRVTQAFDLVQTLLSQRMTGYHRCDTALDVLIQLIQQHYQMLPLQLSAVDMEMLTAPRGNSVHQNVNLDAELYHQRREKQLEVLLTAMQQIFQKLRESHQEKDLRHYLQDCQHELSHLHQKYAADVQSLQRSSDEAYLAVQVHSLEHEKTIDQLKVDNQRNLAIQREHYESQLANSNDSLHEVCQAFDYVTVLMLYALTSNPALGNVSSPSLNDTNASTSPVIKATDYPLHFAYQISSKFAHGYAILLHDVKTLCELSAMPTDEVIQQHCDSLAASPTNAIPAVMSLMNYMDNGITGSASLETYQSNTVNKRPSLRSVALMILAANRWIRLSHKSQRSQAGVPSSLLSMEVSSKQQIAVDDIVASYLRSRSLGVDGTSALDRLHCFFPSSQLRNWKADELALQLASIHNINEVKQEVQKRVQDFVQHLSSRIEAVDKDQQKMKKKSTRPTDNDHKYVLSEHMRKRLHNRTLFEVLTQSNEDGFVNMHFHHHPKTLAQVHARPTEQEQLRKKKELFAQYELNHLHQYIVSKALEQQENSLKMNSLHVSSIVGYIVYVRSKLINVFYV